MFHQNYSRQDHQIPSTRPLDTGPLLRALLELNSSITTTRRGGGKCCCQHTAQAGRAAYTTGMTTGITTGITRPYLFTSFYNLFELFFACDDRDRRRSSLLSKTFPYVSGHPITPMMSPMNHSMMSPFSQNMTMQKAWMDPSALMRTWNRQAFHNVSNHSNKGRQATLVL